MAPSFFLFSSPAEADEERCIRKRPFCRQLSRKLAGSGNLKILNENELHSRAGDRVMTECYLMMEGAVIFLRLSLADAPLSMGLIVLHL